MKQFLLFLLLSAGMLVLAEEPKKPVITTPKGWNTNLAKAAASAQKNPEKTVAILFAGQDQPKLQKEVLLSPEFLRLAKQSLELAYVPLPKPPPKKEASAGEDGKKAPPPKPDPATVARAKYKVRGNNCTLLLLDHKGKEIGRLTRIEPATAYTIRIRKFMAPVPEIIQIARSNNIKKMTQYLEEHPGNINTGDAFGNTAVLEAVRRNNIKMLELLFSKRGDANRKYEGGLSPIMVWSQRNQKKTNIADILLANGAAINARDNTGRTALMIAIQANARDTVTYLLSHGARIDAKDKKGETPLMYAIRRKNPAMIQLLLDKGARVLQPDMAGNTPLHIAVTTPGMTPQVVQLLLKNGARKTSKNYKQKRPFDVARDAKIKGLVK